MTGPTASHQRPVKSAAGRLGRHLATPSTTNSNNHVHNKRPAIIDVSPSNSSPSLPSTSPSLSPSSSCDVIKERRCPPCPAVPSSGGRWKLLSTPKVGRSGCVADGCSRMRSTERHPSAASKAAALTSGNRSEQQQQQQQQQMDGERRKRQCGQALGGGHTNPVAVSIGQAERSSTPIGVAMANMAATRRTSHIPTPVAGWTSSEQQVPAMECRPVAGSRLLPPGSLITARLAAQKLTKSTVNSPSSVNHVTVKSVANQCVTKPPKSKLPVSSVTRKSVRTCESTSLPVVTSTRASSLVRNTGRSISHGTTTSHIPCRSNSVASRNRLPPTTARGPSCERSTAVRSSNNNSNNNNSNNTQTLNRSASVRNGRSLKSPTCTWRSSVRGGPCSLQYQNTATVAPSVAKSGNCVPAAGIQTAKVTALECAAGKLPDPPAATPPAPPSPTVEHGPELPVQPCDVASGDPGASFSDEAPTLSESSVSPSVWCQSDADPADAAGMRGVDPSDSGTGASVSMETEQDDPADTPPSVNVPQRAQSRELLTRLEHERKRIRGSVYLEHSEQSEPFSNDLSWLEQDIQLFLQQTDNNPEVPDPADVVQNDAGDAAVADDNGAADPQVAQPAQSRSLSLPKSFLSQKYGLVGLKAALPSVLFPWRKSESKPPTVVPPVVECSQPAAPNENVDLKAASLPPSGLSQTAMGGASRRSHPPTSRTTRRFKSNSSPVFSDRPNRSHSAWDLGSRPWSHYGGELSETMSNAGSSVSVGVSTVEGVAEEGADAPDVPCGGDSNAAAADVDSKREESSPTPSASPDDSAGHPLRRFRKSFSLRLSRRSSHEDAPDDCSIKDESMAADGSASPCNGSSSSTGPESGKFRFGPLVWRASRERSNKKGTKAARSAKCNSGDSGVQMESSPPTSSIGHQADEEAESLRSADSSVRRTRSDLGGDEVIAQALGHWNGPDSTDGTASVDSAAESTGSAHPHQYQRNVVSRSRKMTRYLAKTYLRRSASQPVVVSDSGLPAAGSDPHPPTPSDVISDSEDAGLCLSEDDLSDHSGRDGQPTSAVNYAAASDGTLAIALWDHSAVESGELSLKSCDVVHILDFSDPDWWWAAKGQQYGWVPSSYVKLCEQPSIRSKGYDKETAMAAAEVPRVSSKCIRTNVIHELVTAERDYVKLLNDLVDGYLIPMRNRPDLFSSEMIEAIFGNLESLYEFQKRFLVNLEHCLNWNSLEDSVVGTCFIQHRQEFQIYSTYCNNQDRAAMQLQSLYQDVRYVRFFEACRLLRRMIRLPLEAFLLSPVQKICKYPLQLAELLKHTPEEHPDRPLVSVALDSMRSVAYLVNESKRRAEMQQHLVNWQRGVEHWQGSDITASNTRLVRQGDLFKISSTGWTRDIILFLYDKELVLCKKELMKRHSLVYKDRLSVEDCEIVDIGDGRDLHFNVTVRHAFKVRCLHRDKWFLFAARSAEEKGGWLQSLRHLQQQHLQQQDWHLFSYDSTPSTSTLNLQRPRHKMSALAKRSKGKYNPAVNLTLEEAHRTLHGCDMPKTYKVYTPLNKF